MIPPSLMNASYLFTLIPFWEEEPVPPPPCTEPAAEGSDAPPAETTEPVSGQPEGDADGVNDEVAVRLVFKGFRLGFMTDWVAEVNPGYERFVEHGSDDDADRQRQDQRARNAVRPNPHAAGSPEQPRAEPSAPSDSGE
jgi:hypothetical protein